MQSNMVLPWKETQSRLEQNTEPGNEAKCVDGEGRGKEGRGRRGGREGKEREEEEEKGEEREEEEKGE